MPIRDVRGPVYLSSLPGLLGPCRCLYSPASAAPRRATTAVSILWLKTFNLASTSRPFHPISNGSAPDALHHHGSLPRHGCFSLSILTVATAGTGGRTVTGIPPGWASVDSLATETYTVVFRHGHGGATPTGRDGAPLPHCSLPGGGPDGLRATFYTCHLSTIDLSVWALRP